MIQPATRPYASKGSASGTEVDAGGRPEITLGRCRLPATVLATRALADAGWIACRRRAVRLAAMASSLPGAADRRARCRSTELAFRPAPIVDHRFAVGREGIQTATQAVHYSFDWGLRRPERRPRFVNFVRS
jgi:hypothetical protein